MATAQVDDVKARWVGGDELPVDEVIEAILNDAELICFASVPDLEERLTQDATGILHKNLIYVECQLVVQVLTNPKGIRQVSESSGDFSHAVTYGSETLRTWMTLSAQQRQLLGGRVRHAFTIDMTPQPETPPPMGLLREQIINLPEVD